MLLATGLFALLFLTLWAVIHMVLPAAWRAVQRTWTAMARALLRRQRLSAWYARGSARLRPLEAYRTEAVIVAAGFLAAGLVGVGFAELAELVRERSAALERLDHGIWAAAHVFRSPGATTFFTAWTILGTPVALGVLVGVSAAVLLLRGRRRLPLFLVGTCVGAWALNHVLKAAFTRARPALALALRVSDGYAFPSGHAMTSVVVFGALVYVVMLVSSRWAVRSAAMALAVTVVAAICVSRIYLGVHWLSDIAGGLAAGLVWLVSTVAAYEVARRVRSIRGTPARP